VKRKQPNQLQRSYGKDMRSPEGSGLRNRQKSTPVKRRGLTCLIKGGGFLAVKTPQSDSRRFGGSGVKSEVARQAKQYRGVPRLACAIDPGELHTLFSRKNEAFSTKGGRREMQNLPVKHAGTTEGTKF